MRADELKLRITTFLNEMVDTYFANQTIGDRMLNYTLKIIVKNNIYKIEPVLELFKNENGEINANEIINEYANMMRNESITFDLRNYVDNSMIKSLLPDKALIITSEDISKIIGGG